MNFTDEDFKLIAQMALQSEYGFAPALSDITLLEASGDGTYILFRVKDHEYRFNSHLHNGGVVIVSGTVEKIS